MSHHNYSRIATDALRSIEIPRALTQWRDEIEGAAMLGVASALKGDPQAPRHTLQEAARNAALNEIRDELRRRGARVTQHLVVTRDPARFEQMPDDGDHMDDAGVGDEPNPPASLVAAEQRARARDAAKALPPQQRRCIELRYTDGATQAEAAAKLGVSETQLRRIEAAAIAAMRRSVGE